MDFICSRGVQIKYDFLDKYMGSYEINMIFGFFALFIKLLYSIERLNTKKCVTCKHVNKTEKRLPQYCSRNVIPRTSQFNNNNNNNTADLDS